ncbi:uncharacterized protein LOC134834823 [Culicoides brevitarsis]|uniref:uncharacterized protein LOC134834823 n=1 Tax=Culicoides brevitarsis TaxID=469753 RepID=UPI00307BE05F
MPEHHHTDYETILALCERIPKNATKSEINLENLRKMLESTINTSKIVLHEAHKNGNEFVKVYEGDEGNLTAYHETWKNKKPEDFELGWIYPNNKRLPKNYQEDIAAEFRNELKSGDIKSNATQLLAESYVRIQYLYHGLWKVLQVVDRDGHKIPNQEALSKLRKIFENAIEKAESVKTAVKDFLKEITLCEEIAEMLEVPEDVIRDFEYEETRSWIVFREYANQLEFNIQAFQTLVDRIVEEQSAQQ